MNTSIHLAKRPKGDIVPGETFQVRRTPIPKNDDVEAGQVLVRVEYLSVDPGISSRESTDEPLTWASDEGMVE